ncbi:MAG: DUF4388 domain-containing protein [Acidobacteriota bacterium]|nr:DUF4388 domain-containing protein [Blastocatellia bacterium]MDW8411808.1 DUF4388 domain-containing protein [Acidobacteriota bacterium]
MKGDLAEDSLPDILKAIYKQRKSGSLRLMQGQTRKEIFFELGGMIFASSNRKEDRIGETMLRHGMLSQQDYERVQSHMGRGKRFGKIIVELGIMSERELIANVTIQILDIIYSVFNWTTGTYEFLEVEKSVSDDLKLELSTASIILEGVRRISNFSVIERGLGDLNRLIGPATNPLMRLQTLNLKPVERQIIEMTAKPVGLLRILVDVKMPADIVLRAVYGLLSAGVLEHYPPAKLSRFSGKLEVPEDLKEQVSAPEPVVKRRSTSGLRVDEMAIRRRLMPILQRIASGDRYALLEVKPGTSLEELQAKYFKLARELHPDRFLNTSLELRRNIEDIFQKISEAYESIRQEISVDSGPTFYLEDTRKDSPQSESQPDPELPITAEMKKESDISTAVTRKLLDDPSARLIDIQEDPMRDTAEEPALEETDEATELLASPTQADTAETAVEFAVTELQKPVTTDTITSPTSAQTLTRSTEAEQNLKAEELFLRGKAYFQARDIPNAVRSLRNAVQLRPTEPRYLLLLGHVLSSHQKWQKEAEDLFKRVLQIDPNNAMAHVGLGQLYGKIGLSKRAETEFREALRLDPQNQIARKGLQSLERKSSGSREDSSGFISLFGNK